MAQPGTKTIAYIKPAVRGSWELNGEQGWYIGLALYHYCCVTVYIPKKKAPRVCHTVNFLPTVVPFPDVKLTGFLRQAATDIIDILTLPLSTTTPSLQAGDPTRNELLGLATQLLLVEKFQHLPLHFPMSPYLRGCRVHHH